MILPIQKQYAQIN